MRAKRICVKLIAMNEERKIFINLKCSHYLNQCFIFWFSTYIRFAVLKISHIFVLNAYSTDRFMIYNALMNLHYFILFISLNIQFIKFDIFLSRIFAWSSKILKLSQVHFLYQFFFVTHNKRYANNFRARWRQSVKKRK